MPLLLFSYRAKEGCADTGGPSYAGDSAPFTPSKDEHTLPATFGGSRRHYAGTVEDTGTIVHDHLLARNPADARSVAIAYLKVGAGYPLRGTACFRKPMGRACILLEALGARPRDNPGVWGIGPMVGLQVGEVLRFGCFLLTLTMLGIRAHGWFGGR